MNFTELYTEALTSNSVNIDAVEKIESGGNPKAINKTSGSRGAMQILNKKTWDYIVKDMGQEYDWDKHWHNRIINREVGSHYLNVIIPRYLKTYKLPDSPQMRIAAYNSGIGNALKAYRKDKEQWQSFLPHETKNYLAKYNSLTGATLPASTPKQAPIAKKPIDSTVHVVKKGDTISHIAKKYKLSLSKLKTLNPDITDLNKIGIGDKIKIV